MGGGKGGGGTNTVTQQSSPPPEVMEQYRLLMERANQVADLPLNFYGGQQIAGFTPDQEAGFDMLRGSSALATPYFNMAGNYLQQGAAPINMSASAMAPYMDPYMDQVVNSTMANITENNRRQQQDLIGNAVAKGAWGSDRAGIAQAELARQQNLATNQAIGGLRSQGFQQGVQNYLNTEQANRLLAMQGAQGAMGLGSASQQSAMQEAAARMQSGAMQQQLAQAILGVPYSNFMQEQGYPFQTTGWLSGISTGLGSGMGGTSSSTQPGPSALSQAIGTAAGLGSLGYLGYLAFSDERIKEDIERVGNVGPYPVYDFKYKDGVWGDEGKTYRGVMAQDVEKINPSAVAETEDGVKMVNYAALNRGGAIGLRPRRAFGGRVPYIPDVPMMRGAVGIPSAPAMSSQQEDSSIGDAMNLLKIIGATSGTGGTESLASQAATGFTVENAKAHGLGDMVEGFRNPDGSTNFDNAVDFEGNSVAFDSPDRVPYWKYRMHDIFGIKLADGGSARMSPEDAAKMLDLYPDEGAPPAPVDLFGMNNNAVIPTPPPVEQGMPPARGFGRGIPPAPSSVDPERIARAAPINEPDPILNFLSAAAAIGAGTSPYFGVNAGAGAQQGIKTMLDQRKQAATESYQRGSLERDAQKLAEEAEEWRNRLAQNEWYYEGMLENQAESNALQRLRIERGGADGGQLWFLAQKIKNAMAAKGRDIDDAEAIYMAQTGFRQGTELEGDEITPLKGAPETKKTFKKAEAEGALEGSGNISPKEKMERGKEKLKTTISSIESYFDDLEKEGGAISTDNSSLDNMWAYAKGTPLGQQIGRAAGTKLQSARNKILMSRPRLVASIMEAYGLSARQMDSNVELKLQLDSATDPNSTDIQANREALRNIKNILARDYGKPSAPPKSGDARKPLSDIFNTD